DSTYEKERLSILAKLKLAPDSVVSECLGATSQFDSATAGLGLFARNRRLRKASEKEKKATKSHRVLTLDKQNLRKRLVYSKELNEIVKEMGDRLMNDEEIPLNLWTQYDRLQRNPNLKQRTLTDLELGTATRTPGPGAYIGSGGGGKKKGDKNIKIPSSFGKSERWGGGGGGGLRRSESQVSEDKAAAAAANASYMRTGKLSQRGGMKWGEDERGKLNDLYWELGRPKRRESVKEHYELYALRHRVLFKNRPKEEIIARVKHMLKFNMFKELGEADFWSLKKKDRQDSLTAPCKSQRPPPPSFASLSYASKRAHLKSPFSSVLSNRSSGPAMMFPQGSRRPLSPGSRVVVPDPSSQSSDPPDFSSLGVQSLSEMRSEWGRSFLRAGGLKSNLSASEEHESIEPTSTTYRPLYSLVTERAPSHPMYDRPDGSVKIRDKFEAMTGPGSYEEGGSVGAQTLSTRENSGKAAFTREDRLKFMSV
ncbi:hypothetical protein TrRE_jg900, partial [Triparma retinervis]